jgi:hypothetical protein
MLKYNLLFCLIFTLIAISNTKNTVVQLLSQEGSDFSQISFESENKGYMIRNFNNGTMDLFNFPESEKIISINNYQNLEFNTPLTVDTNNFDLLMTYENSNLKYDNVDQWTMSHLDDFQGSAMGWSKEKLSVCGANDNMFLGGHCNFGGEEVYKNFTALPRHSMIRITANFHFFDKWEGEEAFMLFNGQAVWSDSYKWCDKVMLWYCKKYAINACGAEFPDRLSVPIDFISK